MVVATGNVMIDQFKPWYFGVAFALLFKYCTGMPDMQELAEEQRYSRAKDAPRVEPPAWVRYMSRRADAQLSRDYNFGFGSWKYIFRTAINFSRTLYTYDGMVNDAGEPITAADIEQGTIKVCQALRGECPEGNGKMKEVRGDITKVKSSSLTLARQQRNC